MIRKHIIAGALAALIACPTAFGFTVQLSRTSGYFQGSGGEFTAKDNPTTRGYYSPLALVSGGFETFCIEKNELASPLPGTFDAVLNTAAVNGGAGGPNPDPISRGTTWIYDQFALGTLVGYNYTPPGSGRAADAEALQNTIWWLEEEIGTRPNNEFTTAVLSNFGWNGGNNATLTSAIAQARGNNDLSIPVMVMNLTRVENGVVVKKQDMLIRVPDGGMMLAMLGSGLFALAAFRRRMA